MNRKAQRAALITEARQLATKSETEGRDLTADEVERAVAIKSEVAELDRLIKADEEARAAIKAITDADAADQADTPGDQGGEQGGKSARFEVRDRREKADAANLGDAFVKSEVYERFRKTHPSGIGTGTPLALGRVHVGSAEQVLGQKALITTDTAQIPNLRYPTIDQVTRPRLTLLDIITRGSMAGNFEYLQITNVNRGAGIVPEATGDDETDPLKPLSDFTTQLEDAKAYTYADGYEVTTQMLSDAPGLATFLNNEIPYSIDSVIADKLLNGEGTDGEPRGIRNTTGVQTQAFDTDTVTTIRRAITKVTRIGGPVTAVLMSPEADEEFDLMQDANGRYLGNGPWSQGPGTIWGRPRVVSEQLSGSNEVILGDWSTVALLDREGLTIEAFNQHKDFAQRNKVYVRAELRAGQVIWRPNRLVRATIADA